MIFDKCGQGAVIVSAGLLLGAFSAPAIAQAVPDSESSTADQAPTARSGQRPAGGTARTSAPSSRLGAGRAGATTGDQPVADRSDRTAVPAVPVAAAARSPRVLPSAADEAAVPVIESAPSPSSAQPASVAKVIVPNVLPPRSTPRRTVIAEPAPARVTPIGPPAVAVTPPSIAIATRPQSTEATDELAGGSGVPLQSGLAWTMLAAARNEVGRRSGMSDTSASAPVGQEVSPLGTPEQLAAESMAMATARSLPMLAMKAVLGLAWRIIGSSAYGQIGGPDKANMAALGKAVDEWAMGAAFQLMILNSNDPKIVTQVAPPHQWYGQNVAGSRILYDNPDTIYRFVGVNYASQYVITGRLPENDPQASFSVLTGLSGTTATVLDADKLDLGPDRTFVITVSGQPALPGQKNHLQITPDTTLIAIRDTLSDWDAQDPMSLAIHRTDGPRNSLFSQFGGFALPGIGPLVAQSEFLTNLVSLIPPLPSVPPIVRGSIAALLMLRGISEESKYIKVATTDATTGKPKAPNVFTDPVRNASFLATQLQSAGYFQLADDQALVLTITPNSAGYFVAPVTNDWTITDNYWDAQTSLNNTQARSNPDGSYTLVVSTTEPTLPGGTSVWNWVSTGGLNQGTMAIRFQSIDPDDPVKPTVGSQVVSLGDLAPVLPPGTVVVTPEERAEQLAVRRAGFDRRFAPYPQTA